MIDEFFEVRTESGSEEVGCPFPKLRQAIYVVFLIYLEHILCEDLVGFIKNYCCFWMHHSIEI